MLQQIANTDIQLGQSFPISVLNSGTNTPFTLQSNNTTALYIDVNQNMTFSGTTLNFSGTAQRITGDLSNATIVNRLAFQTNVANSASTINIIPNGTSSTSQIQLLNASDPTNASTAGIQIGSSTALVYAGKQGTGSYLPLTFYTSSTEQMRLDASGNLGLGVTPSAWGSGIKSIQVGNYSALTNNQGGYTWLSNNAFYDTAWKYLTTNRALYYAQDTGDGGHKWFTAPSGTAGNPITFTQAMTLDASGNLGVGTSSPNSKLHLSNTLAGAQSSKTLFTIYDLWNAGSNGQYFQIIGDSNGINLLCNWSTLSFGARSDNNGTSTPTLTVNTSGNVGIGTSAGNGKLDVRGTIYANYGVNGLGLIVTNGTDSDLQVVTATNLTTLKNTGGSGALAFGTNNIERIRIDSSGNVGIGTTGPGVKFDVAGSIRSTAGTSEAQVLLTNSTRQVYLFNSYAGNSYGLYDGTAAQHRILYDAVNNYLAFYTGASERVRIDSSGNLLVGTTTNLAVGLTVVSNTTSGTGYFRNLATTGITSDQLQVAVAQTSASTFYLSRFYTNVSVTPTVMHYVRGDGVGYFSSTCFANSFSTNTGASYTPDRINFSSANFYVLNGSSVGVNLVNGATSWAAQSDERIKNIIEPITNAVKKVSGLRTVIGNYKSDDDETRRSFLIAQDVQKVLPEAVSSDDNGILNLRYTDTIPLLVAAIKELTDRLEKLEAK